MAEPASGRRPARHRVGCGRFLGRGRRPHRVARPFDALAERNRTEGGIDVSRPSRNRRGVHDDLDGILARPESA
ncbi:MAG: hypothetical protein AVDCRST_MAG66-4527 [uncultured Pseudonocardia sp.]|uniref:Uncharacterized protein n=1 Tax=uncultured Pseudonocardia sp. TaxID=211455 RepID=A0A6J4QV65_9PSEU|nr:MAG: hypothetical protein AVDCRST_MAG66-4527 [uncultured Pseudonocardia sp.]